jgi:hypothetical protein
MSDGIACENDWTVLVAEDHEFLEHKINERGIYGELSRRCGKVVGIS